MQIRGRINQKHISMQFLCFETSIEFKYDVKKWTDKFVMGKIIDDVKEN